MWYDVIWYDNDTQTVVRIVEQETEEVDSSENSIDHANICRYGGTIWWDLWYQMRLHPLNMLLDQVVDFKEEEKLHVIHLFTYSVLYSNFKVIL